MIPAWVERDLEAVAAADALRSLRPLEGPTAARVRVEGRELRNFSSNDYLGLAADPRLAEAAGAAARRWGSGAGASRLITGTLGIHGELEEALAALKGAETALLFSTGYQANLGLLQALAPEGVILSDELNHASLVDGCRLARAQVAVYRHGDTNHLADLLSQHADAPRTIVATDGVFSMDGDLAPLPALLAAAEPRGGLVIVDDAHATGVLGAGRGTAHHLGVDPGRVVHMGTLGKALGSFGAFVAGPAPIRDLLVNRARSLIYTTAPPPPAVGAALAALGVLRDEPWRLGALERNGRALREGLRALGFRVSEAPTPIVPLVLGGNRRTLRWSRGLWERGFWVHPIRPPTVPEGTSRLRLTVTAAHTAADLAGLLQALAEVAREEDADDLAR
ncbi:MAG: 8-amino-7-oxononanoate synthase [Deltaproteobacteria bacterium]|nr:8-amino-7-oxononanoate synthase [Deltaproteobacteria bacterium]